MKLTLLVYSAVVSHTIIDCPVVIPKRVLSSLAVILCASSYTFPFVGNHQSSLYLVSMYSLIGSYIYFCLIIAFMRVNSNVVLSKTRLLGGIVCTTIIASGELMEKGRLG